MNKSSLILQGPMVSTGYGITTSYVHKTLTQKGVNISCFPIQISNDFYTDKEIQDIYASRSNYSIDDPFLKIFHPLELSSRIGKGDFIGFPFFEIDHFDSLETKNLINCDKLFVSSEWGKGILEDKIKHKNIDVIPLGVDTEIFDHTKYQKRNNSKYIFCTIGKWEIRKCHDILLNIFEMAFTEKDDVELWICASVSNAYNTPEETMKWETVYKSHKLSSKIKIIPPQENHHSIASLISQTDCGLYPSRAEGWNLELLETMAMNKPVIASNYSAHTEFCDSNNSYLIDIHETCPAQDGKFFQGQANWAKIGQKQIDQMVEYMRYLYSNNIRNNPNGVKTGQRFSWSNTADKIINSVYQ